MKKSAFTLIELLVVIVIIAILAGIALPVFGRVTERAKATEDLNNLRQIGIGTAAYLSDHEDILFKSGDKWPELLNTDPATAVPGKYVPNWKAFRSAFDKREQTTTTVPVSYGININILTQTTGADAWDGNVSKMDAPSSLIYMAPVYTRQKANDAPVFTGTSTATPASQLTPGGITNQSFGTHSNGKQINVLYMDNHVSSIKFGPATNTDSFQNITGDEGKKRWQPKATTATP